MLPEPPREALRKARSGDAAAFRTVVETVARYAFNLAYRMTSDAADAEDLTQEIFLRLFQNMKKYDPARPFAPWFRRVATNTALNWCRGRKSRPIPLDNLEIATDPASTPGADAVLRKAIRALPEEYRVVVSLRYLEDLSIGEIAEAIGSPTGTVKTWLFRAREMLKDMMKGRSK